MLKTSDFDFHLPPELIANQPANPRDSSKMLVWKNQKIIDKKVSDLADFLNEGDVLVLNDTKVIKAKLTGKRGEAKVEVNLHKQGSPYLGGLERQLLLAKQPQMAVLSDQGLPNYFLWQTMGVHNSSIWQVFAKPAKRLKIGDKFSIAEDFFAEVMGKNDDGIVDLKFNVSDEDFFAMLEKYGEMPLPPYIKTDQEVDNNYQTIYAKNSGAVAAPTAGLHFTKELFAKLEAKGVQKVFTTLNVGAGTFLPVKSDLIKDHQMHSEYFSINQETCEVINQAKKNGKRIIAVGTTSLRVLESAVDDNGLLNPQSRETNIFIYPPYNFKIVDILMTNFHLPKSTLFMLISAFIGTKNAQEIYSHAIKNQYRFYSFGDATLLFKNEF